MGWLGTSYLVTVLIMDTVLVYFSIQLLKSQNPDTCRQAMRGAYLGLLWELLRLSFDDFLTNFISANARFLNLQTIIYHSSPNLLLNT